MTRRTKLFATTALLVSLPFLVAGCAETPKSEDAPATTEEPIKLELGGYYNTYFTVAE